MGLSVVSIFSQQLMLGGQRSGRESCHSNSQPSLPQTKQRPNRRTNGSVEVSPLELLDLQASTRPLSVVVPVDKVHQGVDRLRQGQPFPPEDRKGYRLYGLARGLSESQGQ